MPGIVCAIRGGPSSQPTIERAMALARETDLPLHFLYVVNLDFLAHTSSSRVKVITHELHQMGDFILLNAKTQAEAGGIHAHGDVRQGSVMEEIISLCHEIEAKYVVLGSPSGVHEDDLFTLERIRQFAERIEHESGATVILAERGEL